MVMMSIENSWQEDIEFVISSPHTRIPVYQQTRDDVVGILNAKDLLPVLANGEARPPLTELLRAPIFVPETKRLDDLLEEFRKTHNHLALVLDEYGGVSGLVTMEDILEEIVGDIVDEYDRDVEEEFAEIDEHTVELLARVHLDELNERLGLNLPDDGDFDTIGGFIFSQLGHIPDVGEEVIWDGVRIEVIEATPRRIERLKMTLPEAIPNRNRTPEMNQDA
jgi:CBS domain containing-hemolysin-like protein